MDFKMKSKRNRKHKISSKPYQIEVKFLYIKNILNLLNFFYILKSFSSIHNTNESNNEQINLEKEQEDTNDELTSSFISRRSINDSMKELKHLTEITSSLVGNNENDLKSLTNTATTIEIMNNEFFLQFAKEFADKFSKKFIEHFTSHLINSRSN